MSPPGNPTRTVFSWLFIGALFVLCGVLGVLQYRMIGEVSDAARERLRQSLRASLNRFSADFDGELSDAARAIAPSNSPDVEAAEAALPLRYRQWKTTARRPQIFARIALAAPRGNALLLGSLDLNSGALQTVEWPAGWSFLKQRLERTVPPQDREAGREGPPPGPPPEPPPEQQPEVFEAPVLATGPPGPGPPYPPFGPREIAWILFEANVPYLRDTLLPEMLQRDLPDYQVAVVTRTNPPEVIYESEPGSAGKVLASADASVSLLDSPYENRQSGRPMRGRGPGGIPGRGFPEPGFGPEPAAGRWQMFVRNRAGSLEAVVASARRVNLALTTGVLLLLLASAAALIRLTERAQSLAALQMGFVSGVSHELCTPLTVIHTAAYNLQGKMAHNPEQVERYGALIRKESGRLKDLVEQVLRFAGAEAGRVIHEPERLSVESVIDAALESSRAVLDDSHCLVEKAIQPGLPLILGDATALQHALQNLLGNAAKYGAAGHGEKDRNWIGIFASQIAEDGRTMVEIRVADRGPGISAEEQEHIFDPFFRGQRAAKDQVHGTGLGLSLAKKIVEAHGGAIRVESAPMKGAEFIVRIPGAAAT